MKDPYYWSTDVIHSDNSITMIDYLDNHLEEGYEVLMTDGTYAEIKNSNGEHYAIRSSGNGDFFNHKIEFEKL